VASPRICLGAWKADGGLDNLLRATVWGRRDIRIRGNPGASGTFAVPVFGLDQTVEMRTWRERGVTMVVSSVGLSKTAVDRFVVSLQPSRETDWRRLETEAATPHLLRGRDASRIALAGTFDGGTWDLTVARRTVHGERRVLIGRQIEGTSHGAATAATGLRIGMTAGTRSTLLWGTCDPATIRLVLTLSDGSKVSPQLVHSPAVAANVFALWRPDHRSVTRAIAYETDQRPTWQGEPNPKPPHLLTTESDLGFIGHRI
jgi:hypothetical protein